MRRSALRPLAIARGLKGKMAYPAPLKNRGAFARLFVIPGRAKREPGIQMQSLCLFLDSG
jgi:hypothetical protein